MNRRGSALLIVLGVLSFLVVSAVAFSAFMRRARLPSSYLRRSVAARELAKGALARAIDEIDRAIADDVHPGIGSRPSNRWRNRVFFKDGSEQDVSQTAPTLTFEGLAYIPPPLVNEARYWSRKTPTAVWSAFGYDTGRYAYCALDVSDYFDVNRLAADYPRSSAANRRITAAHLFEDVNHRSAPSGADAWDTFMEQFRDIDEDSLEITFDSNSKMPLVSVADFNLALGDKSSIGKMKSPFVEYLKKEGTFYDGDPAQLEAYAAMTFVTDGWFPRGKKTVASGSSGATAAIETYDLSDSRYQPYQMSYMQMSSPLRLSQATSFYKTQVAGSTEAKTWYDRLSGLGMTALADYLDADHVPVSIAVPTTERVPMICGVELKLAQSPSFGVTRTPDDSETVLNTGDAERRVEQSVRWTISPDVFAQAFQGGRIHVLVAYPFLHKDDDDNSSWTLDGKLSLFFTSETAVPFRTKNANDVLHMTSATLPDNGINVDTGVMTVKLEGGRPNFPAKITEEDDAVWEGDLDLRNGVRLATDLANPGNELLKVTYQWTQTREENMGVVDWVPKLDAVLADPTAHNATLKAHTALPALYGSGGTIGARDADFVDNALTEKLNANPNWSKKVHLNAAVWLRIKDSDGKVVDMVPASIADDPIQNSKNDPMLGLLLSGSQAVDGSQWPLLKFGTGVTFDFGIAGMRSLENSGSAFAVSPAAVMVPDPRHNHMPENWYADTSGNITKDKWLETNLAGDDDTRDGDIFMATSDAGYLQSIYELAFLPRFTNLETYGNSGNAGNYNIPQNGWNNNEYATESDPKVAAGKTLNAGFMWRTYDPIGENKVAFANLPFTSEGTGMKVNPYSDSTNVLMAAFANTPVDWRHAHTNYEFSAALDAVADDVSAFNNKYAWNEYSEGGKFAWEDLQKVAGHFMWRMRNSGNQSWQTVWNDIDWYGLCSDGKVFASGGGQDMQITGNTDELWDVDRKFLYGYWRDCFAAKQQLFLIFVRAEPLMLGGGTADQLPPQLGARAVALVWRDPTTSSGTTGGYPHRTRLLFYRPLD
ncbi:MAG: hypothetical protein II840_10890 [Kiritimatiellae bacterium]|nr:hypothetical protein [Kiritimatiellia bacterium]